ncbi:MAG: hypothetical protein ABGW78_06520 [Pirellulales bacterium]
MPPETLKIHNGPVTVTFFWTGDRWSHQVIIKDMGEWKSVEGLRLDSKDVHWPASPTIVEISQLHTSKGAVILGVGQVGRSHFSAAIGPDKKKEEIRFEIACRVNVQPQWLGSTYENMSGYVEVLPQTPTPKTLPATIQWAYSFGATGLTSCRLIQN